MVMEEFTAGVIIHCGTSDDRCVMKKNCALTSRRSAWVNADFLAWHGRLARGRGTPRRLLLFIRVLRDLRGYLFFNQQKRSSTKVRNEHELKIQLQREEGVPRPETTARSGLGPRSSRFCRGRRWPALPLGGPPQILSQSIGVVCRFLFLSRCREQRPTGIRQRARIFAGADHFRQLTAVERIDLGQSLGREMPFQQFFPIVIARDGTLR